MSTDEILIVKRSSRGFEVRDWQEKDPLKRVWKPLFMREINLDVWYLDYKRKVSMFKNHVHDVLPLRARVPPLVA